MITPEGLRALERILAENPNVFHATARETFCSLLGLGRGLLESDPRQELEAWYRAVLKGLDLKVVRRNYEPGDPLPAFPCTHMPIEPPE